MHLFNTIESIGIADYKKIEPSLSLKPIELKVYRFVVIEAFETIRTSGKEIYQNICSS